MNELAARLEKLLAAMKYEGAWCCDTEHGHGLDAFRTTFPEFTFTEIEGTSDWNSINDVSVEANVEPTSQAVITDRTYINVADYGVLPDNTSEQNTAAMERLMALNP